MCNAGYVCISGAAVAQPTDSVTGHECQPGYYCPKGSDQGIKCPQGTFSNQTKLENVTECEDCTPGKYCQTEGKLIEHASHIEQQNPSGEINYLQELLVESTGKLEYQLALE